MNCYKCATPLPDQSKFCMACGADVSGDGQHQHTVNLEADPELLAALQQELGDDFVVERELGRGGMAIVYLGQDKHLGRKVAIKLLPPMLTFGSGPGFIERFKREARTAATLDHPNIIPVYRVSTGGKLFWYVMKFLPGESLDVILKREGALEIGRTVDILAQAAEALDYAHQNAVVHRDVKPANMMLDKRGRVVVTDFGIAKAMESTGLTNSGATIGTPHYMSPEQCRGIGVSGASDQYALAVTAYQMLSGHLPFSADSVLELMRMHADDPPPPLGTLRPGIPPEIIAAVERGMAKAPEERFPTCAEFIAEMGRANRDALAGARRPTPVVVRTGNLPATTPMPKTPAPKTPVSRTPAAKGPAPKAAATVVEQPAAPEPPRPSRRVGVMIAGAVGVVILGVVALKMFGGPDSDGSATATNQTAARVTGAESAASTPQPEVTPTPATGPARLELRGVPANAVVTRDGERVSGSSFDLQVGKPTVFEVSATGFTSWKRTFTPDSAEQQLVATVALQRPRTQPSGQSGDTKQSGSTDTKSQTTTANPTPTTVSAAPGKITVATNPLSVIIINGKPMERNPVFDHEVPSGRVRLRFEVTDATGAWAVDTVVTVPPGETLNMRRITLRRP